MHDFQPEQYGPKFAELLSIDRCRPLDEGQADRAAWDALSAMSPKTTFEPAAVADRTMAQACLSGVWLLYDYLDDSHNISQGISGPTGSFWHGIMHRREGDFSNAKYWFRNVGYHPVYEPLARVAEQLADQFDAAGVLPAGNWDAMAFVDACQQAVRRNTHAEFCRAVQQAEWELLFDHCYQQAIQ
ncbi:hypothetical protein [Aeoliella mucimassa]|uniref:Uncharacterized protein n=1 Tax=Aeoliella mucimassa TaxID=2527972 RepID=A0A518AV57_9BACT|nr:hypothetical protein [Aeoliella mucimassa]QDU58598.1 hypothetical protein Pan181_48370 [Aeoliella mucimassa]